MALPDNQASSTPILADYIPPYDRYKSPFVDFEEGGIALYDGTQGTQIQFWTMTYDDDELSPGYGDFTMIPESFGSPTVVLNVANVKEVCMAFNQNMDFIICYYLEDGSCKYYYYDTVLEDYQTLTLPAGSRSPQLCLDDHRWLQTGEADDILAYIRAGTVYYRQERDRYTVERTLGTGVGDAKLYRVGMTKNGRLKFDVSAGSKNRLSEIVGDLCKEAGITADQLMLDELYPTIVRGYMISSLASSAECIRGLQRIYFFDMPEIDSKLHGLMRGRDVIATITHQELVYGHEVIVETAREQEVEFPSKLHLSYASAETDYAPTKETSERLTPDVRVRSEINIECFVNLEADEAAQRANILHKSSWVELAGEATFGLSENWARLVPSNILSVEIRPGTFKRMRIKTTDLRQGLIDIVAKYDRKSAWTSGAVAPTIIAPTPPPSALPGDTTWAFMDLPALLAAHDTLHYYAAGHGSAPAWNGAQGQRELGVDYQREFELIRNSTLGVLDEALAFAPEHVIDITNSILVTSNRDLESITTERLFEGANAAVIFTGAGYEILQFRDVVAEGLAWRLSYLLRGRLDTIPTAHSIADQFVLLTEPVLVPTDIALLDQTFNLRTVSYGQVPSDATPRSVTFVGESQTEWSPIDLVANQSGNDWILAWTPRLRLGTPANPIGSAHWYGWRLQFTVGATVVFYDVLDTAIKTWTYTEADQITDFGSAQGSFNDVSIMALNQFTGPGRALSEAV
jgi:hypothetical protein